MTLPPPSSSAPKVGIEALPEHPDRIDVRSPSEFAIDRIPGAVNLPVLNDAERAQVGVIHARESGFAAKRYGASIVARNVARILEEHCRDKPREWAPLVYCWRGGKRSASLAHVLKEVGWRAVQLAGGYQTYRRYVVAQMASLPPRLRFVAVCGLTGSGKSRLLRALDEVGAQVLDLETLAKHRGSLLGDRPDDPQPSQKAFDSGVLAALSRFDPSRPVFVESESRKIGTVQLGDALLVSMRAARCVRLDTPRPLRVALLKEDYAHFLADPQALADRLSRLVAMHGRKTIERWNDAARAGEFDILVDELLARHYDPTYARSIEYNFSASATAITVTPTAVSPVALRALARQVVAAVGEAVEEPAT
ncbi:MAG TPA: tRNA 2-selenouridine(34) synthase MnmH [Casimicrobiaceae bacterium]|nr:tRNA 2-selenouridine(34) synthase MnmH [Casimicrobiaceae bacterium]